MTWDERATVVRRSLNGRQSVIFFLADGVDKHMAEGDLAAMDARLDCPLCGGSGHIGDCDATAAGDLHHKTQNNIWDFIVGRENADGKVVAGRGHFLFERIAEELSRRDLEMMRESMRATGAGNNTINKMQAYMRAILAWGVDQQLTNLNPWRDYKRLPVKKKNGHYNHGRLQVHTCSLP